jgi:hypothetical protein
MHTNHGSLHANDGRPYRVACMRISHFAGLRPVENAALRLENAAVREEMQRCLR